MTALGRARQRVVIGIGNPDRGDDGAGRAVARRLDGMLPPDVELVEAAGEATDLLGRLSGADAAFLIDACRSGAPAGTVRRFDAAARPLPAGTFGLSTHGLGLADAIELARALGRLPGLCVVYAIEGASFATGAPMSADVLAAVDEVATRLTAELVAADVTARSSG